jgi:Saxitoxin biosynthesis operon protein SxtJ
MAARVPARLSAGEGRKFGLTVGGAFLALGALLWWRGRPDAVVFTVAGLGAVLALAALLVPTRLGPVFRAWMGLAEAMSKVTTPVLMAAVYFLVFTPVGLVRRLFGRDPLARPPRGASAWVVRGAGERRSDLRHQF